MRKGVKGLQNIQLLKWCKEFDIKPIWNILCGFPDEPPEEYYGMAKLVPLLTHLHPPESMGRIRIDRFSPNFEQPERLGFIKGRPFSAYYHIYPFPPEVVENLAYFFQYNYQKPLDIASYTRPLWNEVDSWKKAHQTSDLFSVDKVSQLLICDLRLVARQTITILSGLRKDLFLFCDSIRTSTEIKNRAGASEDFEELLQPLLERGLMIREGNSYLNLAIPLGNYSPSPAVTERFYAAIRKIGITSQEKVLLDRANLYC